MVISIENARYQAARQDFSDHNAFVCNEWEKHQVELLRQLDPVALSREEIWSLDPTEGNLHDFFVRQPNLMFWRKVQGKFAKS